MKNSLATSLTFILLGVGLFTGTPQTRAALLACNGFDYVTGNMNGDDGGSGWTGAWTSSSAANIVTGTTLSYTGGSISKDGSGTALSITGGGEGALNRSFVGTSTGNEVYFSLLFQSGAGSTTAASSISYVTGTTNLLVGRLSSDGTSGAPGEIDRVDLWVNPTSLTPGTAAASVNDGLGLTLIDLDVFSSRTVGFGEAGDQILIDELRIGTAFASVVSVPEPSVAGLLPPGGASLLASRRMIAPQAA